MDFDEEDINEDFFDGSEDQKKRKPKPKQMDIRDDGSRRLKGRRPETLMATETAAQVDLDNIEKRSRARYACQYHRQQHEK